LKLKRFTAILLIVFVIISITGCNLIEKEEKTGKEIDGEVMVASVNNENITKAEYDEALAEIKGNLVSYYGEEFFESDEGKEAMKQIKEGLLEDLITNKIISIKASDLDLLATDEETEDVFKQLIEDYGGQEEFDKLIEEQEVDIETIKQNLNFQLTIEKLMEEVTKEVEIDDGAARKYYDENPHEFKEFADEVKARHILVDNEDEAKEILEKLENDADFEELAKEHSIDPGSKDEGGDLGYFIRGTMVPEFDDAVFNMEVGEISDIVMTPYGYHIIKLEEKTIAPIIEFDEIKDQLEEQLLLNKKHEEFHKEIDKWRKSIKTKKYI